ncbi:hypothetical protein WMY93_006326 [Mugilogobius chulae]|uniref:ubiquitinyl hydrolase 1 n=1 Tax=Mugilogobius chulae TaxID=88201 RepID=A0AAW0PM56_9GOBI
MDSRKENKGRKQPMKPNKRKEQKQKTGRFIRRKSLRSLGNFMGRILKTLGTLAHFGEHADTQETEDDDGGFGQSGTGGFSKDSHSTSRDCTLKKSSTALSSSTSQGSVKERLSLCYGDKTPGVQGLKNHGNTCFMNAVVQCLSNTDLLAEYLGLEQYKTDVGSQKRANGDLDAVEERRGSARDARGEVTEQLASLVRALWTLDYTPQLSVEFKSIVAKYASQFRGNSQHDALEFLLWLLDRVHEDANPSHNNNNSSSSKAKSNPKGSSSLEESLPQQPRGRHSFVQEHFQAQYRSSLTCPHCLKQSNTFDPFLCISLPIPLRQTRPLCVTLVFNTKGQRYVRVGLAVPLFGSLSCLRSMVAEEGSLSPDQVILSELYSTGFQRSFSDDDDLTAIADSDVVYAFQAPPVYNRSGSTSISGYHHSLPSSPYSSGSDRQRLPSSGAVSSEYLNHSSSSKVLLLICNTAGSGQQAVRFGPPFLMREDRSISWEQLQQSILSKLYYLMLNGSQAQNAGLLFKIRVVGGSASYSYLSPQDNKPLFHPAVDRALKFCGPGGPPHVKLVIEWDYKTKECLFGSIQEEVVKDAESVRNQQQQHLQQHTCTLDECFQLYTKEEQLAPDDAWKCPHCKQLQQGMVKMSLWTLPDILILHLKRFRQVGERRNKLTTQVHFPLCGLDMAPHVVKRSQSMKNLNNGPWPPSWRQSQQSSDLTLPHDYLYDLYAVCNHHGGMHGGHYTAYCRNSVDGQWYSYDDSSVDLVPEEEVCTRGAYILFYQRRNNIPPWSASSSVRGSTSSSMSDHWLIRLNGDSKRGSLVSRSSTAFPSSLPDSPVSPVFSDSDSKEERGGFEKRPFVRGLQGRSLSMRAPSKTKETLSKVLPLRWSLGSKDRRKPEPTPPSVHEPAPVELVQYLESGRRPKCTKDPIESLMTGPPNTREGPQGQAAGGRSSSVASMSCLAKSREDLVSESPQVPQGQRRPSEKTGSLRRSKKEPPRDEPATISSSYSSNTLSRRKDSKKQHSSKDSETRRGSAVHPSYSTPSLHEDSLGRNKDEKAEKRNTNEGHSKVKGDAPKNQEGLLSFLKGNFLKKDIKKSKDGDSRKVEEVGKRTLSRLSLSNGAAGGGTADKTRPSASNTMGGELPNGKPGRTSEIKRSQSSSNIPTKAEQSVRRTASLHRNGMTSSGHASSRNQTMDSKSSYGTFQRTRYSTTSLGRKKTVPESSF